MQTYEFPKMHHYVGSLQIKLHIARFATKKLKCNLLDCPQYVIKIPLLLICHYEVLPLIRNEKKLACSFR